MQILALKVLKDIIAKPATGNPKKIKIGQQMIDTYTAGRRAYNTVFHNTTLSRTEYLDSFEASLADLSGFDGTIKCVHALARSMASKATKDNPKSTPTRRGAPFLPLLK